MVEIQKKQKERNKNFADFKATKEQLYSEFENDFKEWQVELGKNLSIKFTNPEVLFESEKAKIKK